MAGRARTRRAKGGQSAAEAGAGLRQGNTWDPEAASVRRGGGGRQAEEQEGWEAWCWERGWSTASS